MCRPGLSVKIQKLSPETGRFANELQMAVAEARVWSWGMRRRRQSLFGHPNEGTTEMQDEIRRYALWGAFRNAPRRMKEAYR